MHGVKNYSMTSKKYTLKSDKEKSLKKSIKSPKEKNMESFEGNLKRLPKNGYSSL